ncbi:Enoyl-CoA hydratase/carnithine racemase [Loktanella fryxellensis]|uniref:Enoyl-CoA hydratase/carnithine racemase n=1 Tax=Loktanella fryxellensis TaxID=245187 RepID=A0A1H8HTI5_9RHOB|nr:enoyl-CoA hydratase/isomerase family protein [Loktanella fryxellensis]SEN59620.1 Enoyl-CoA hydratase/carnithine racemase [Loktanella fryxellensis]
MIRHDRDGRLSVITLDRADKANALTAAMLADLLTQVQAARDAHAVILTGAGTVFSAGADLADVATLKSSPLWEDVSAAIAALPGLTVAALNGTLAGGACGMALACDLRVAVPGARVFYPVMRLGVLPQPSDPARLLRLAGPGPARRILLAGERLTADQALACGLIDRIADDALSAARAMCADALAADLSHVAAIKGMLAPLSVT